MRRWFIRDFQSEDLTEVFSFKDADSQARKLSRENSSGLMEVLVEEPNGLLFVVAVYLRGKKRYQGKRARDSRTYNRPPTM